MKKNIFIIISLIIISLYYWINKCIEYKNKEEYNKWVSSIMKILFKQAWNCDTIKLKDNQWNNIELINIKCKKTWNFN